MSGPVQPAPPTRYCRKCDYDLSASEGPVCPECGRAFSPGDAKTWRSYPRRSWRSRWRRWRWVVIPVLVLIVLWPKGWVRTMVTWVDPVTSETVSSDSLLIAHPWWAGRGWYPPIGRTTQSAGVASAAPAANAQNVRLVIDLWRCDSANPWRYQKVGRGQIAVAPPARGTVLTADEWTGMIRRYTRTVADKSGMDSAPMWGMNLTADEPDWTTVRKKAE